MNTLTPCAEFCFSVLFVHAKQNLRQSSPVVCSKAAFNYTNVFIRLSSELVREFSQVENDAANKKILQSEATGRAGVLRLKTPEAIRDKRQRADNPTRICHLETRISQFERRHAADMRSLRIEHRADVAMLMARLDEMAQKQKMR